MNDEIKQDLEDYKNGDAYKIPPTEEQVEETKKSLSSAIGAMFKKT